MKAYLLSKDKEKALGDKIETDFSIAEDPAQQEEMNEAIKQWLSDQGKNAEQILSAETVPWDEYEKMRNYLGLTAGTSAMDTTGFIRSMLKNL